MLDQTAAVIAIAGVMRVAAAASTVAPSPTLAVTVATASGVDPSGEAAGVTAGNGESLRGTSLHGALIDDVGDGRGVGARAPSASVDKPRRMWLADGLGWALAALALVLVLWFGVHRAVHPRTKGRYGRVSATAASGAMVDDALEGVDPAEGGLDDDRHHGEPIHDDDDQHDDHGEHC